MKHEIEIRAVTAPGAREVCPLCHVIHAHAQGSVWGYIQRAPLCAVCLKNHAPGLRTLIERTSRIDALS